MNDLFKELAQYPNTFEEFRKWLFIKLNKNVEVFKKFGKQPNSIKIPYLIKYLESKEVPILDMYNYYSYKLNYYTEFEVLQYSSIIWEFNRIENKKTTNYIPF